MYNCFFLHLDKVPLCLQNVCILFLLVFLIYRQRLAFVAISIEQCMVDNIMLVRLCVQNLYQIEIMST
jgi:hypothetical protein